MAHLGAAPSLALFWTLCAFSIISVALRFTSAAVFRKGFNLGDAIIILALGLAVLFAVFIHQAYTYGLGHHAADLIAAGHTSYPVLAHKWVRLALAPHVLSTMCSRTVFALYLMAIIGGSSCWQRRSLIFVISAQLPVNVYLAMLVLLRCGTQFTAIWGGTVGHCLPPKVVFYSAYFCGAMNVFIDLYLAILPGYIIIGLQLPLKRRLIILMLLCSSILVAGAGIAKTVAIRRVEVGKDPPFDAVDFITWASVEIYLLITLICVPTWYALFADRETRRSSRHYRADAHPNLNLTTFSHRDLERYHVPFQPGQPNSQGEKHMVDTTATKSLQGSASEEMLTKL